MSHRASLLNRRPVPARGLSCGIVPGGGRPIRVLVLTAPVGEGHLAAARALAEDLVRRSPSAEVIVRDVLAELPAPLRWFLNDAYRWQLKAAPWLFGLLFGTLRRSRLLRWLARAALSLAGSRSLLRLVRRASPGRRRLDVAARDARSSAPCACAARCSCPRARRSPTSPASSSGPTRASTCTSSCTRASCPDVERIAGRGSARPVSPLVAPEFLRRGRPSRLGARSACRATARSSSSPAAAGAWATSREPCDGARARRDRRLPRRTRRDDSRCGSRRAFAGEPRVQVLGFTDSMSDLLAAADVLVHSTGGVTCLEALARDCPVVAYGAPPGHAPLLAREMAVARARRARAARRPS